MTTRLRLPARIRNKRNTAGDFEARMALADRIAELPEIDQLSRYRFLSCGWEWLKIPRTSLQ